MKGLKKRMTYQEMTDHMLANTVKLPNRVNVGRYARRLGYSVYKAMINRKVHHFYVNEHIAETD